MSDVHRLFKRIGDEVGAAIMSSTVPIYRDENNKYGLDFNRTGLLFRIGSERFVLTAAHEIAEYREKGIWIYADVSQGFSVPIPLVQSMLNWTEVDDNVPDRDIAAIHLDQNAVDQFYPQRRFLTLADCDQLIDPRPALYMVAGYTWDSYRMEPVASGPPNFFILDIEPNPTTKNFDPHVHIALALDGYGLQATDTEFVAAAMPEFNGMSGCGIWRVAPSTMTDPDAWDPSMVRLVAIQNRTRHGSHTIGTWFKHVVDRIVLALPNLKPATEIQHKPGY